MKLDKSYYNNDLTFANANKTDHIWVEDIKKIDLLSGSKLEEQTKRIKSYGFVIGQARNEQNPELCGLYHKLLKDLPIDETLTPENAKQRGYEFMGDTIYDREAPLVAMKDVIELVEKKGYKLGQPASIMAADIYQGLYAPLKK